LAAGQTGKLALNRRNILPNEPTDTQAIVARYRFAMHTRDKLMEQPPAGPLRFGRLLVVCLLAVAFCGWLVWFAVTYLPDCCGP
jgi:hypothetical protein